MGVVALCEQGAADDAAVVGYRSLLLDSLLGRLCNNKGCAARRSISGHNNANL
jgi:hypothetical protein